MAPDWYFSAKTLYRIFAVSSFFYAKIRNFLLHRKAAQDHLAHKNDPDFNGVTFLVMWLSLSITKTVSQRHPGVLDQKLGWCKCRTLTYKVVNAEELAKNLAGIYFKMFLDKSLCKR